MKLKPKSPLWPISQFGIWVLVGGLILISISPAAAGSTRQSAQEGAQLFQQKCKACHTIGQGDLVGPDLQGVTQQRDLAWLKGFIAQPDKVIASGDATAQGLLSQYKTQMPNLGLTDVQVQSLVAYLENPEAASAAPVAALSGGKPQAGQALFTGGRRLTNGGPPCIACHSSAGITAIGGGSLGPDLTHVYSRLGSAGLTSGLQSIPFPTMQGIFANRPLTPQEQADLFAYFQQADASPVTTSALSTYWLWGLGGAGALVLFGVMLIFWPRQSQSVSVRLRKDAQKTHLKK